MKQLLILILFLIIVIPATHALRRHGLIGRQPINEGSITFSTGPSYSFGETYGNPMERSFLNKTNFYTALGFRYSLPTNFGAKADFFYGDYTSLDDSNKRHLGSKTNSIGLSVRGEYTYYFGGSQRYRRDNQHAIYGFLGFGVASCSISPYQNPTSSIPYEKPQLTHVTAPLIPFGGGYSFMCSDKLSIGLEAYMKYSLTDFLDGYHRYSSSSNDVIVGASITVSYHLFGRKGFLGH